MRNLFDISSPIAPRRRRLAPALLVVALSGAVLAACGGGGDDVDETQPTTTAAVGTTATTPVSAVVPTTTSATSAPPTTVAETTTTGAEPETTTTVEPESTVPTEADATEAEAEAEAEATVAAASASSASTDTSGYWFSAVAISADLAARMTPSSWREGCPVGLEDLRYVTVAHWGFDGGVHQGELVVNADTVGALEDIFRQLYAAGYPITQMRLIDDFGGDDDASIDADNTSAFNCRSATGSSSWSNHAYGRAIDINPLINPYVFEGGGTSHAASETYLDRSNVRPGMIVEGDAVVAAFDSHGWDWGGRWSSPVDRQHFSSSGG